MLNALGNALLQNRNLLAHIVLILVWILLISAVNGKIRFGAKWLLGIRIVVMIAWAALIVVSILHRDQISTDDIFRFTPQNEFLAAVVLLVFFAIKSVSMVIYVGLLYAAAGIMFPLPLAIVVNILGTAIMVTIPYWIGRSGGAEFVQNTVKKYPKLAFVSEIKRGSDFWFSFIIRLVGMFPSDIISIYMGAIRLEFRAYLLSCVLAFLPPVVTFSVMGMSLTDIGSPNFKIAFAVEAACVVSSAVLAYFYGKKLKVDMKNAEKAGSVKQEV